MRDLGFFAAARAFFFGQGASFSVSVSSVTVPRCVIRKIPSENTAVCFGAPGALTEVSSTAPFLVSTVEPIGIVWPAASVKHFPPFGQTCTVPPAGSTTTV